MVTCRDDQRLTASVTPRWSCLAAMIGTIALVDPFRDDTVQHLLIQREFPRLCREAVEV